SSGGVKESRHWSPEPERAAESCQLHRACSAAVGICRPAFDGSLRPPGPPPRPLAEPGRDSSIRACPPVLHLPQMGDQDRKRETALEILDLWKAIDGLPYSHPLQPSKRNVMEAFAKPEIGDLDMLSKKIPKEEDVLKS
uniref:Galanin like peptide n=1 Tax=Macaca fascicularis TaxID=9541 RepID=A0A2K5U6F5_MACFA